MLTFASEFPSLSNNPQLGNAPQSSLWSTASARNISAPVQQPGASQPSGQDDPFTNSTARGTPTQASFRFGNPGPADNGSGQTQGNPVDDFPPLNRSSNGETGADRTANLISSLGLGSIGGAAGAAPSNRGNGLLNALSANSRANEPRSPPGVAPPGRLLVTALPATHAHNKQRRQTAHKLTRMSNVEVHN